MTEREKTILKLKKAWKDMEKLHKKFNEISSILTNEKDYFFNLYLETYRMKRKKIYNKSLMISHKE